MDAETYNSSMACGLEVGGEWMGNSFKRGLACCYPGSLVLSDKAI